MEAFLFFSVVSFFKSLPYDNPALLDLAKVVVGSTMWIGGMLAYMYLREKKLKTLQASK
jgi:hypothetical protein